MADEDDKIRRNLVVVSSVILVSSFLKLPVSALIELFAKSSEAFKAIPQADFWAIGLTVLVYLVARYRFSDEGEKTSSELEKTYALNRSSLLHVEVLRAQNIFNQTGRFLPQVEHMRSAIAEQTKANGFDPENCKTVISLAIEGVPKRSSRLIANIKWSSGNTRTGRQLSSPHFTVQANWPRFQYLVLFLRASLSAMFYSKVALQQLMPYALAWFAMWVLLAKVIIGYLIASN